MRPFAPAVNRISRIFEICNPERGRSPNAPAMIRQSGTGPLSSRIWRRRHREKIGRAHQGDEPPGSRTSAWEGRTARKLRRAIGFDAAKPQIEVNVEIRPAPLEPWRRKPRRVPWV